MRSPNLKRYAIIASAVAAALGIFFGYWLRVSPANLAEYATIAAPIIFGGGFSFAYRQLKAIRNARMAEIILSMTERWGSKEMEESRRQVNLAGPNLLAKILAADQTNSEEYFVFVRVMNFFETLGNLVMEGFLDKSVAYELFSTPADNYFGLFEPYLNQTEPKARDVGKRFTQLRDVFLKETARRKNATPRPVR